MLTNIDDRPPYLPGEMVVYTPRPVGPERVDLVEYRPWPGCSAWCLRTSRPAPAPEFVAHRYDIAENFRPARARGWLARWLAARLSRRRPRYFMEIAVDRRADAVAPGVGDVVRGARS